MLTDRQSAFALEYAMNGGNATAAAKTAGYSLKSAHEIGRQLLENIGIQEAIHRELMRQRFRSGAVGLQVLVRIATNDSAPAAARVAAARSLMEHGGLLGTAKEIQQTRNEADNSGLQPISYKEVLLALRETTCLVNPKNNLLK